MHYCLRDTTLVNLIFRYPPLTPCAESLSFHVMQKQRLFLWLVVMGMHTVAALATPTNNSALWRPRFATPAIVALDNETNRQFTAEIRASASATNWSASIANDLKTWPCQVVSAAYGQINRGTEPGWQLKLRVPADASPELFTLRILSSEGISEQAQSVSVSPAFAADFYILHITDEQIVNQIHTDPSGQYFKMVGSWDEMKWMQEPVNLIHPRFVMVTGDQIDFNGALDGWNNWANWGYRPTGKKTFSREETLELENRLSEMYLDCHQGYKVPYVETPGNHDVTPSDKVLAGSSLRWHPISVSVYEKFFGQRSWSFRMGDFYVLMHDWSEQSLKRWAESDYEAAQQDPTITCRIIGQHFNTDQAYNPKVCDLMLIGHYHKTDTVQTSPYFVYIDGPAFRYGMTGFFNFRRTPNGWSCDQTVGPRDTAKDVWPLFTDHGKVKKVRIDQPDSMSLTTNCVTIVNDLPENFYDGRVRFILNKGSYQTVKNGVILSQYDCADGAKTAVLVKVNIPATNSIVVSLPLAASAN